MHLLITPWHFIRYENPESSYWYENVVVRHTKRQQLSRDCSISYGMKLWCDSYSDAWQRSVVQCGTQRGNSYQRILCIIFHTVWKQRVSCCGVWLAQRMSCQRDVCVAHVKMLSGTSKKQLSSAEPCRRWKFWAKKNPQPFGQGFSYGMKLRRFLLADFKPFFF